MRPRRCRPGRTTSSPASSGARPTCWRRRRTAPLDGYRPPPEEQDFERGLQEKLEQIQAWLDRLRSGITAEFEQVRALCDVVDALIGGHEWSL